VQHIYITRYAYILSYAYKTIVLSVVMIHYSMQCFVDENNTPSGSIQCNNIVPTQFQLYHNINIVITGLLLVHQPFQEENQLYKLIVFLKTLISYIPRSLFKHNYSKPTWKPANMLKMKTTCKLTLLLFYIIITKNVLLHIHDQPTSEIMWIKFHACSMTFPVYTCHSLELTTLKFV